MVKLTLLIAAYIPDATLHLHRRFLHQLCNYGSRQRIAVEDALGIKILLPSWTQITEDMCLFHHVVLVSPQNGRVPLGNRNYVPTDVTSSQARQEGRSSAKLSAVIEETAVSTGPNEHPSSRVNTTNQVTAPRVLTLFA